VGVADKVRRLIVVPVEGLRRGHALLFHETDTADIQSVLPLLVFRNDFNPSVSQYICVNFSSIIHI
jgi:hypothetical protein